MDSFINKTILYKFFQKRRDHTDGCDRDRAYFDRLISFGK